MGTEIEAKLKVDRCDEIEQRLKRLGAEFVGEHLQSDHHYDDARGTLRKSDKALRIRCQRLGQQTSFFMTCKGPKEQSNFKKRTEFEFELTDVQAARGLLKTLGYEQVMVVEKTRRLWRLNDCEIALDRLPLLGEFVEIEGPSAESISEVQNLLGLSHLRHIAKSYAALTRAKLRQMQKERPEGA